MTESGTEIVASFDDGPSLRVLAVGRGFRPESLDERNLGISF